VGRHADYGLTGVGAVARQDLGFYAREGPNPDLQLIQGTPHLIAGMRAGQIDVAGLTAYEAVLLTARSARSRTCAVGRSPWRASAATTTR
jgi:ABC-type nitrate/sulfonate/bicarbonate transport system substrate-binding protein